VLACTCGLFRLLLLSVASELFGSRCSLARSVRNIKPAPKLGRGLFFCTFR
jgi:hypothetical protein